MDYKNALLGGVAGLLALTAGMQEPANAAIQRPDTLTQTVQSRSVGGGQSEAFLDLLMRTNGSLSSDAIEDALAEMYSNPSREQVQNAPGLLRDFAGLGFGAEGIQRLRDVLGDIVSSAENLDAELRASVVAQLDSEVTPFVFAQARRRDCTPAQLRDPRRRAECDPAEVGATPRDPREIGQSGPGVGGGYR
jgi:hypothetical protein